MAHQACLNTAWEHNGSFLTTTDAAEMTDGTILHNSTVQRAVFRLIHPAPRRSYHITTKRTHQPWSNEGLPHKGRNNPVLIERTRESHKQPGHQQNKEWQLRRQDSFHYKWLQKIQDYTSYKTLQLFVPNSKRLGGYTQWVYFFFKKVHITQKTSSR